MLCYGASYCVCNAFAKGFKSRSKKLRKLLRHNVVDYYTATVLQTVLDKTGKEIKDRNDKSNTTYNWASNDEKEFCEGIQPFLVAVKTAWRNPSSR